MRQLPVLFLLGGCFGVWGDGGQSGTEVPDMCEEAGRTALIDLSVPADGMTFAPQATLDGLDGAWTGDWTPIAGDTSTTALTFTGGVVELVEQVFVPGTVETGAVMQCGSYYAIAASVAVSTADGSLDEVFETTVEARDASSASFAASIALSDVGGAALPTSFDPGDWDHTELLVYGAWAAPAFTGGANWQAFDDASDAEDGTVEVSGMTEGAGTFSLLRSD